MICFISSGISKAMRGEVIGGAEKQQAMILKGLKSVGVDVIVIEYYLKERQEIDGILFYPAWNDHQRSYISRLKSIINQIRKHNVSVLYARGTQTYIAFLYLFLKVRRSKLRLYWGIAGDHDLTSKFNKLRVNHAPTLYGKLNAGIIFNISSILTFHFSDIIICQTKEQIQRCRRISRKKTTKFISNIFISENENENGLHTKKADAVWIGKFSGNKGENILLNIAEDIPEMTILCLGPISDEFKKTKVFYRIQHQNNLILLGRVPTLHLNSYIRSTDFVLNTSPSEGLSNVFLEGWNMNKPVISYKVDPNRYLSKGQAGFCAKGNYEKLILRLKCILKDEKFMRYHGKKGYEILIRNHNPELILSKYKNLFLS